VHNADWTPQIETFDGVEMAFVPAGCFQMGDDEGEIDEIPPHRQCFAEPFYIERYEVTNAQFARFGGQAAEPSRWPDDNRPRNQVTWYEARDFCELRGIRLPTEAEWEYAARGPDGWRYPWGTSILGEYVVLVDNAGSQTAEVGSKPGGASWVGAYDMSGNVREWVSTIYSLDLPYPYHSDDGREDMDNTADRRVQRGGGFLDTSGESYTFTRDASYPDYWGSDIGFRCARSSSGD
jgi:formylglycine-generating enzyme required for sulfatase activity